MHGLQMASKTRMTWLVHTTARSNRHGKSARDNRFTDLVKLLDMAETTSGSNVQTKKNTCYRNLT